MSISIPSPTLRRRLAFLLALLAAALVAAIPAAAQEIHLQGLRGEKLSEGDLSRGTTILVFWTSWSPHSRDIVARVNPLSQRWGGKARVMTVSFMEERPAVEGFLAGKGLAVPVFLDSDGAFSRKHAVANLPVLLVIRDGQEVYKGRLPEDPDSVIAELLGRSGG
jgi:thiol-disulfide isomerase/thioredoxin